MQATTAPVKLDPVTETFYDVENLLWHMCHSFVTKHGGNLDDCMSIAHEVYMDVYRTWVPGKAPFSTLLATCIYRRLLDEKRKWYGRACSMTDDDGNTLDIEDKKRHFDVAAFAQDMSVDCQVVLSLVFDTPRELAAVIQGKGGHARNISSTVRDHLRSIGWSLKRISETFAEIGAAL